MAIMSALPQYRYFITGATSYTPGPGATNSAAPTYTDASGRIVNVPMPDVATTESSRFTPHLVTQFSSDPSTTVGQLTRSQWADYVSRFSPIENQLMGMTTYNSPGLVSSEIAKGVEIADNASATATGMRAMNRSQYGLTPRAGQQALEARQDNLTRSTAVVDAANRIRQSLIDRNRAIASGTIPNAGRAYGLGTEG